MMSFTRLIMVIHVMLATYHGMALVQRPAPPK